MCKGQATCRKYPSQHAAIRRAVPSALLPGELANSPCMHETTWRRGRLPRPSQPVTKGLLHQPARTKAIILRGLAACSLLPLQTERRRARRATVAVCAKACWRLRGCACGSHALVAWQKSRPQVRPPPQVPVKHPHGAACRKAGAQGVYSPGASPIAARSASSMDGFGQRLPCMPCWQDLQQT